MSEPLGYKEFCWMSDDEVKAFDPMTKGDYDATGYVLEVDLEYPKGCHDRHNELPLAAEAMRVEDCLLSPYTKGLKERLGLKGKSAVKLVPNLLPKTKYVIHYRNLKQCLRMGLKLTKIYRILEFKQSRWLAPYIDLNTRMRQAAKTPFAKDFFKLMNNSVFGKTMENLRRRVTVELIHTEKRLKKVMAKPNLERCKIFNEDLVGAQVRMPNIELVKPLYVGLAILDLSKLLMIDFHYNVMKKEYGENATLLYSDTDSFVYSINTENFYEDMEKHLDVLDTSDYPREHALYSPTNKKVIGKFKDEMNGSPISEFVGLRSKMYSIKCEEREIKRAKGISKTVVCKKMKHKHYWNALFNETVTVEEQNAIKSIDHVTTSVVQKKRGLSCYDDKRFILEDKYTTLAYGHYKTLV